MNDTLYAILDILEKNTGKIIGSREISRQLRQHGINLTERTVRYHLKILDERGFTKVFGREGRMITPKGKEELMQSLVSKKIGFVISKIENLAYLTDFNLDTMKGNIILNVSFFLEEYFEKALKIMKPVFSSPFVMSDKVVIKKSGDKIGDILVPEKHIGFGTVCSVTINGIFLKAGIPVSSKFGGVLQIDNEPIRFIALISYDGSSLDPLEIFIRSKMTDVNNAVKKKSGKILASFREIPIVSIDKALYLQKRLKEKNIGGILKIGEPNQSLLEIPVGVDKAGVVIVGGLNPIAALEESGIPCISKAMSTLYEFSNMIYFKDII